jgi:hypothetical protein
MQHPSCSRHHASCIPQAASQCDLRSTSHRPRCVSLPLCITQNQLLRPMHRRIRCTVPLSTSVAVWRRGLYDVPAAFLLRKWEEEAIVRRLGTSLPSVRADAFAATRFDNASRMFAVSVGCVRAYCSPRESARSPLSFGGRCVTPSSAWPSRMARPSLAGSASRTAHDRLNGTPEPPRVS